MDHMKQMELESKVKPIIELLETGLSGGVQLLESLYSGQQDMAKQLLTDLVQLNEAVDQVFQGIAERMPYSCIGDQLDNIRDTLQEIQVAQVQEQCYLVEYQLLPFLHLVKEAFYFWGCVYPSHKKMETYYQNEFAEHYKSPYFQEGEPSRYQLSIVVPAYNHLDVTKRCIEHILQYVDLEALNAELVLVNHGSTDGTLEYFRSIPNAKVIHLKHNVRMYMFCMLPMICEGAYMQLVSNDILLTKGAVENLLTCIQSDNKIAAAAPMTPNIANLQMLHVPTQDPAQFVRWANEFNQSNPQLWSDRARLMPPTCIWSMEAIQKLGYADPYFYSMEFWDDDFSVRARRGGYRQILCEDTACYHFGSVTSQEGKKKENTLDYGRELFFIKYGVDAWGSGFCYDYYGIQALFQGITKRQCFKILCIDCGFGDTPLQIQNLLKRQNHDCELYLLSNQREYDRDLKPLAQNCYVASKPVHELLEEAFEGIEFDLIYMGKNLAEYPVADHLIRILHTRIRAGGTVVFRYENPFYVMNLYRMIQQQPLDKSIHFLNMEKIKKVLGELFSSVRYVKQNSPIQGTDQFVRQYYSNLKKDQQKQCIDQVSISAQYIICRS